MRQELEARIVEEEKRKNQFEEKINNFQLEEMRIIRRIQTTKNEENGSERIVTTDAYASPDKKSSKVNNHYNMKNGNSNELRK